MSSMCNYHVYIAEKLHRHCLKTENLLSALLGQFFSGALSELSHAVVITSS